MLPQDLLRYSLETTSFEHLHYQSSAGNFELRQPGILRFEPDQPALLDLVVSCGIHGNETAPIELVNQLINDCVSDKLPMQARVLFIFGNLDAMRQQTRFLQDNLNRLFSGKHVLGEPNPEKQRAAQLEAEVQAFFQQAPSGERQRVHYDLHTAIRGSKHEKFAVYPFQPDGNFRAAAVARLQHAGVNTVLLSHEPTGTFSYYSAAEFQAEAFTVELGKVQPFGKNDLSRLQALDALLRLAIREGVLPEPALAPTALNLYQVRRSVVRRSAEFALGFADDALNFTGFSQGDLLAQDGEQAVFAGVDGEAIVFPNAKVQLGHRAILMVEPAMAQRLL